jgi:hypothetical protein
MHKKLIALTCASIISIGIAGVSASADEVEQTSGSYVYGVDEVSIETRGFEKTEKVGGGTWKHRSWKYDVFKHCSSKYYHPSKRHSAYAAVGSSYDRKVKPKGEWANTHATDSTKSQAIVKWSNNPK